MKNLDKAEIFENMPIGRAVMNLSIPMILSSIVMVVYNLTDTYFVGMLNDAVETAAVTISATLLLSFNAINNLFGVGGSSMMSRALGTKDYEKVKRSSSFSFWCCVVFALLFSLLFTIFRVPCLTLLGAKEDTITVTSEYCLWTVTFGALPAILHIVLAYFIRSEGASVHASIGTISGCVINMILDPLFILPWGLNMGAGGAGLATLIGNTFATLYFLGYILFKKDKTFVCIALNKALPTKDVAKGVFIVGIPASIQNLLNVTGMAILNNFAAGYSAAVIAAIGIAQKIYQVPGQVALGMSQGVMPLIGYNYGARNIKRMKEAMAFTYKVAVLFLLGVSILFIIFSKPVVTMFIKDSEIVSFGTFYLKGYAAGLTFVCIDFLGVGCLQAMGKGGYTLMFAVLRKIVLEIPILILLNSMFSEYGLCFAQAIAEFILSIASVIILLRLLKKLEKEWKTE